MFFQLFNFIDFMTKSIKNDSINCVRKITWFFRKWFDFKDSLEINEVSHKIKKNSDNR